MLRKLFSSGDIAAETMAETKINADRQATITTNFRRLICYPQKLSIGKIEKVYSIWCAIVHKKASKSLYSGRYVSRNDTLDAVLKQTSNAICDRIVVQKAVAKPSTQKDGRDMAKKLILDDIMEFECTDGLPCFGKCCTSAPNIWLTPYDIVRIKNNLGMLSGEFLRTYTQASYPREAGYPTIWMRPRSDVTGSCPFSTDRGCAVYADRPWVCRMFPLVPVGADARPAPCADNVGPIFTINKVDYCNGFDRSSETSIRLWREKEGLILYEEINAEWKAVTHHRDFRKRNFLEGSDSDLFFLCCYDIDEFRKNASEEEILRGFVPADRSCETGIDDTALLKLSFKWLRHVVFGETMSTSGG